MRKRATKLCYPGLRLRGFERIGTTAIERRIRLLYRCSRHLSPSRDSVVSPEIQSLVRVTRPAPQTAGPRPADSLPRLRRAGDGAAARGGEDAAVRWAADVERDMATCNRCQTPFASRCASFSERP